LSEAGRRGGDQRPELADVERWAAAAASAAAAKTDDEVVVLRVGGVLALTELFVICSGRNSRQVKAVTDEVELRVDEAGGPKPYQIEGLDGLRWVLMDYGGFVVHVFLDEVRQFYELERLWADVPRVDWRRLGGAIDAVAE
jgi:ribosome-associated protein